jgi:magnesium transporter
VLEFAVDGVATALERATAGVEAATPGVLSALTARVTTANLEKVRRVKGTLSRLSARVAAVRGEVERLLDDEDDMRGLYLTRKEDASQSASQAAPPPMGTSHSVSDDGAGESDDVRAAEELLESVFARLEAVRARLGALDESIDATEDFITFALDAVRNQLITLELLLGVASFALGVMGAVAGFFGMNLPSHLEERRGAWLLVTAASAAGGLAAFGALLAIMRRRGLLQGAGG